jgi:hypothetical protein
MNNVTCPNLKGQFSQKRALALVRLDLWLLAYPKFSIVRNLGKEWRFFHSQTLQRKIFLKNAESQE